VWALSVDAADLDAAIEAARRACQEHPKTPSTRVEIWQDAEKLYVSPQPIIPADACCSCTAILLNLLVMRSMKADSPPPGDPTVLQLLEHERLIRVMASSALTTEELNALLALLEQCGSPVRERQSQEEKGISLRLDCD
jgi:hypothetical protein